jgi:DNA-binding transcriptional regulator YiaG
MDTIEQPALDPTAARIKSVMERRGMNQAAMAKYLGVPQGTIANWLLGTRKPNKVVNRLLDVLGMVEVMAPGIHDSLMGK